jgi:hypothetical protein
MASQTLKRAGTTLGLALIAALAFGATAASAATQYWASSGESLVPYGNSQEFTGKATTTTLIDWNYSGVNVEFRCDSVATSGTVENPPGGGAGEFSASFTLGDCVLNVPGCVIKGGSIVFGPMSGQTSGKSGADTIHYESQYSQPLVLENAPGQSCAIKAQYTIKGGFDAEAVSGSPGKYWIESGKFNIGPYPAYLTVGYSLETPSGSPLALSSDEWSPDPHWYVGEPEWSYLSEGAATSFSTASGSTSFDLSARPFGVLVEIACGGGLSGSLKNPSGGGAGSATATLTLSGCSTNLPGCTVKSPVSSVLLSGAATEAGESPAVAFTPSEGDALIILTFEGGKECGLKGSFKVKGTLVAISEGAGTFGFSEADKLELLGATATPSGGFTPETEGGEYLRLQS